MTQACLTWTPTPGLVSFTGTVTVTLSPRQPARPAGKQARLSALSSGEAASTCADEPCRFSRARKIFVAYVWTSSRRKIPATRPSVGELLACETPETEASRLCIDFCDLQAPISSSVYHAMGTTKSGVSDVLQDFAVAGIFLCLAFAIQCEPSCKLHTDITRSAGLQGLYLGM